MRRMMAAGLAVFASVAGSKPVWATDVPGIDRNGFDTSVRPQDDFFLHVNGGWIKSTEIPPDRPSYGSSAQLIEASERAQRELLEEFVARKDLAAGSLERKLGDITDKQEKGLVVVQRNLERLSRTIGALLDFSRMDIGRITLNLQRFSVASLVEQIHTTVRSELDKKRLRFLSAVEGDLPALIADREKLSAVIENLVINAIKFTPEGGSITVSAGRVAGTERRPPGRGASSGGARSRSSHAPRGGARGRRRGRQRDRQRRLAAPSGVRLAARGDEVQGEGEPRRGVLFGHLAGRHLRRVVRRAVPRREARASRRAGQ